MADWGVVGQQDSKKGNKGHREFVVASSRCSLFGTGSVSGQLEKVNDGKLFAVFAIVNETNAIVSADAHLRTLENFPHQTFGHVPLGKFKIGLNVCFQLFFHFIPSAPRTHFLFFLFPRITVSFPPRRRCLPLHCHRCHPPIAQHSTRARAQRLHQIKPMRQLQLWQPPVASKSCDNATLASCLLSTWSRERLCKIRTE